MNDAPASPQPRRRLWLVRHAAPQVAPGICYGTLDVPAEPAATRAAAERLAAALPQGARVFYSTLQRCEQLARHLQALRANLTFHPDPRLREMDFGRWEGQPWDAIGRDAIDAWTSAFASHRPGDGENLASVLARVAQALRDHGRASGNEETLADSNDVVWVTHAGVMRCVAWLQAHGTSALPRSEEWPRAAPGWGEWEITDLAADGPGRPTA